MSKIIYIRNTGQGGYTNVFAVDPTVQIIRRWGRTHGEAMVVGHGRYFLRDISNRGNHSCAIYNLRPDGSVELLEKVYCVKICPLCLKYSEAESA